MPDTDPWADMYRRWRINMFAVAVLAAGFFLIGIALSLFAFVGAIL
ncbi:hypothetical protein [Thermomonospora umbrina]|uniref:Uncharacterized protein n=1 Tax=Thermomonospora umbrina TaxID=111806 RepID=A0A3D9SNB4_9ACTN|nr:hypothetical protein [Thermomonospora umbrina]REE97197.1 hypothetical protein DFJ69_2659 [Thermomonospora umbrina]